MGVEPLSPPDLGVLIIPEQGHLFVGGSSSLLSMLTAPSRPEGGGVQASGGA